MRVAPREIEKKKTDITAKILSNEHPHLNTENDYRLTIS